MIENRLELILILIQTGELSEIQFQVLKLKEISHSKNISGIIFHLEEGNFLKAEEEIKYYLDNRAGDQFFFDPETAGYETEIEALQSELIDGNMELAILQKKIRDYRYKFQKEVGELYMKVLTLKKEHLENLFKKRNTVRKDHHNQKANNIRFEDYFNLHLGLNAIKKYELNEKESLELKRLFKSGSKLCHPDLVNDDLKNAAQEFFISLKKAYDENDIQKVREICNRLSGFRFNRKEYGIEKELLRSTTTGLRNKLTNITFKIEKIKSSQVYKNLISIKDQEEHFSQLKSKLEKDFKILSSKKIKIKIKSAA